MKRNIFNLVMFNLVIFFGLLILDICMVSSKLENAHAAPRGHLAAMAAEGPAACGGTAAHCVVLTWTASSDGAANPTLGYDIYKGTTSGGESTSALNGSTLSSVGCATPTSTPACEYVDTSVSVGQTLYYTVQASLGGVNSVSSNEVSAKIPPAAPTGLTGTGN